MLPCDSKTRNTTFWVEETSQIMLTAFSLLAANKSTIIKMLSKWFEIFLTLSKSHISWVDYPGQRIYHLLECLSSRKLKDIYKRCFINPYIKTHRKNRRKKTSLSYTDSQWRRCPRLPETHRGCRVQGCRMLKSPVTLGPKPGRLHLGFSRDIQPLWRNQLAVKWGFLKKQISFPWISPFHWYHPFSKKLLYEWEKLPFTKNLLWARPSV